MINKGNKDQVMAVALKVEDQNTGDNKVTFVDSEDEVDNAEAGEYKIHLTAIAADTTEVTVGSPTPASADENTAATDLNSVTMNKAADTTAVTLKDGDNKLAFKLDKAVYSPKSGSELELGATGSNSNNVASNFEITSLAAAGKGITAFTFGGSMNNVDTNWSKLTAGIKITATYSNEIASSNTSAVSGTGAMIKVGPQVSLSTSGAITITGLTSDKDFSTMTLTHSDGTIDLNTDLTWQKDNYTAGQGGDLSIQMGSPWITWLGGQSVTVTVNLTDGSAISATETLATN